LIGGAAALLVAAGTGYLMLGGPPPAPVIASLAPPANPAPGLPAAPEPQAGLQPPPMPAPRPEGSSSPPPQPASAVVSPAPPSPATLATWASRAAALLPACSLVARGSDETRFTLEGVLPRGGEAALREALAASDIPAAAGRLALQEFDGPYCPALAALRPVLAEAGLAPRVAVQGPSPLRGGDLLRFAVTMPDWPAHLYVAYFMKSGEVAHLVPSATHPAGATVRLGEPRAGFPGWEVSEPFGTDLLVAVASEGPLFTGAPRPLVESQDAYLAALNEALRASRAAGRRVMVRPAVIETIAR
jgi:serine/threonine-protein kinase